jgi:hypothetical protein
LSQSTRPYLLPAQELNNDDDDDELGFLKREDGEWRMKTIGFSDLHVPSHHGDGDVQDM